MVKGQRTSINMELFESKIISLKKNFEELKLKEELKQEEANKLKETITQLKIEIGKTSEHNF